MMHSAAVPEELWAELADTAVYLRNRLTTRANKASPFEQWHNRKPLVGHLRVIWADAYAHVSKIKRTKLAPRAKKLKMIGYHDGKKAYRLWDPDTKRVLISCDVVFDESVVLHASPTVFGVATDNDEYVVEAIIDEKVENGERFYMVKWLGYSDEDNTWEPHEHVADTEALLKWEESRRESALIAEKVGVDDPITPALIAEKVGVDDPIMPALIAEKVGVDDPVTYKDAVTCPEARHWLDAIDSELKFISENNTWTIVSLPP